MINAHQHLSQMNNLKITNYNNNLVTHVDSNRYFLKLKFDFSQLRSEIATFHRLIVDARDESRKVIAERDAQRTKIIRLTNLLIRHMKIASQDDINIFHTSSPKPTYLN